MFHVHELLADAIVVDVDAMNLSEDDFARSLRGRSISIPLPATKRVAQVRALKLPTRPSGFEPLIKATKLAGVDDQAALTTVHSLITSSGRIFAGPSKNGVRTYVVAAVVEISEVEYVAFVRMDQAGGKGGKAGAIDNVSVEIFTFSDEESLANAMSGIYSIAEEPGTYLRARGRKAPPNAALIVGRADWMSFPGDWTGRLKGLAAAYGYDLSIAENVQSISQLTKALDAQPELVLALEPSIGSQSLLAAITTRSGGESIGLRATKFEDVSQEFAAAVSAMPAAYVKEQDAKVADLVERLESIHASNSQLDVAPDAITSATSCSYQHVSRLIDGLDAITEVLDGRATGDISVELSAAFAERGFSYAADISSYALGRFSDDYKVMFNDRAVTLGPHLKFGSGSPRTCARIYWGIDQATGRPVIGHVGEHLRDQSFKG